MPDSLIPESEEAASKHLQSEPNLNASELLSAAAIGYAQLKAGETVHIESKEQFIRLVRETTLR